MEMSVVYRSPSFVSLYIVSSLEFRSFSLISLLHSHSLTLSIMREGVVCSYYEGFE